MGLGLLIGGLLVGAAICSSGSSSSSNTTKYSVNNYRVSNQNIRKTTYLSSSQKEHFFDLYRNLDVKLSRKIGKSSKGISILIQGLRYSKNSDYKSNVLNKLIQCRNYRNKLAHSKDKWRDIENPESWMFTFLKSLTSDVNDYHNYFVELLRVGIKKFN